MSANFSLFRPPARRWRVLFFAAPLWFAASPAAADWYGDQPSDPRASETAAQINPFDLVPEIGYDGQFGCGDERGSCRGSEPRRGHDRGKDGERRDGERRDGGRHGGGPLHISERDALMVDCSGLHRNMFASVGEAVHRAPPNATILILPPQHGHGGGSTGALD